jgi:hypothetical protein
VFIRVLRRGHPCSGGGIRARAAVTRGQPRSAGLATVTPSPRAIRAQLDDADGETDEESDAAGEADEDSDADGETDEDSDTDGDGAADSVGVIVE